MHLRSMTDEMAKALGAVPVIPQRSTLQQVNYRPLFKFIEMHNGNEFLFHLLKK